MRPTIRKPRRKPKKRNHKKLRTNEGLPAPFIQPASKRAERPQGSSNTQASAQFMASKSRWNPFNRNLMVKPTLAGFYVPFSEICVNIFPFEPHGRFVGVTISIVGMLKVIDFVACVS